MTRPAFDRPTSGAPETCRHGCIPDLCALCNWEPPAPAAPVVSSEGEATKLASVLGDIRVAEARKADWWTSDEEHRLLAQVLRAECAPWAAGFLASDWLATRDAAQRAAGAETALREAEREMPQFARVDAARLWLRERADRIGGAS